MKPIIERELNVNRSNSLIINRICQWAPDVCQCLRVSWAPKIICACERASPTDESVDRVRKGRINCSNTKVGGKSGITAKPSFAGYIARLKMLPDQFWKKPNTHWSEEIFHYSLGHVRVWWAWSPLFSEKWKRIPKRARNIPVTTGRPITISIVTAQIDLGRQSQHSQFRLQKIVYNRLTYPIKALEKGLRPSFVEINIENCNRKRFFIRLSFWDSRNLSTHLETFFFIFSKRPGRMWVERRGFLSPERKRQKIPHLSQRGREMTNSGREWRSKKLYVLCWR